MPLYEFYSPDTHRIYTFFARSLADAGRVPRCPTDPNARMEKVVSRFAVTGRARDPGAGAGAGAVPGDPKIEQAMAGMEREFRGMDSENPDPRQMARLMRRMGDLTGEKLPAPMQEMMRRMEAGEDPESLEAEYGDMLSGFDNEAPEGADSRGPGPPAGARPPEKPAPSRDPKLYEMSDYLP